MYLEDESHSYHISSLMDRKMKGEKLDGNLEKGFGMLRKDNQPQRRDDYHTAEFTEPFE